LILSLSPRIAELDETDLLALEIEVNCIEEGISMSLNHARLTGVTIRARIGRTDHGVFFLRRHKQIIPLFFLVIVALLNVDLLDRCSSKVMQRLLRISSLDSFVTCVELGPCLLQYYHPYLIINGFGEGGRIVKIWD
jgi:hypothetical protein